MLTSQSTTNIIPALLKFQNTNKGIQKDSQGYSYQYISLDQILELVRPALSNVGIYMSQNINHVDIGGVSKTTCETVLYHTSGEWISSGQMIVEPTNNPKMSIPQNMGSAITYSKRYQLTAILGLSADVDDDATIVAENKQAWGQTVTPAQIKTLAALMKEKNVDQEDMQKIMAAEIHTSKSASQLSQEEASKLINHLTTMASISK